MKIAFISSQGGFSSIIRWITKSKWSHVLIILDDELEGDALTFEASALRGVRLNLWSESSYHPHEIYEVLQPTSPKPLYKYFGSNYGYLQILGFGVAKVLKLKHNPFTKDYVCSELALRFLLDNNVQGLESLEPNLATPEDLYENLVKNPNFKKID